MTAPTWHAVVIGVGNPYRRDDGVGPAVINRLRDRAPASVRLDESDGEPSQLLELWCRAVSVGSPASSHRVDLGDAVALALAVDRMPATLVIYGIEVTDTTYGPGLTPAVETAADAVATAILERLQEATGVRDVPV